MKPAVLAAAAVVVLLLTGCAATSSLPTTDHTFTTAQVTAAFSSLSKHLPTGLKAYNWSDPNTEDRPDLSQTSLSDKCTFLAWTLSGFSAQPGDASGQFASVSIRGSGTQPTAAFVTVRIAASTKAAADIASTLDGKVPGGCDTAWINGTTYAASNVSVNSGAYSATLRKVAGDGPAATAVLCWQFGNLVLTLQAEGTGSSDQRNAIANAIDQSLTGGS